MNDSATTNRWTAIACLPFATLIVLLLTAPNFMNAIFLNPPGVAGWPVGLVGLVTSLVWAAIGVAAVRTAPSTAARMAAIILFTIPASVAPYFLPAMVLIWLNLTT